MIFSGEFNVRTYFCCIREYHSTWFDAEWENFRDFTSWSAIKRAPDWCQSFKYFKVVVTFHLENCITLGICLLHESVFYVLLSGWPIFVALKILLPQIPSIILRQLLCEFLKLTHRVKRLDSWNFFKPIVVFFNHVTQIAEIKGPRRGRLHFTDDFFDIPTARKPLEKLSRRNFRHFDCSRCTHRLNWIFKKFTYKWDENEAADKILQVRLEFNSSHTSELQKLIHFMKLSIYDFPELFEIDVYRLLGSRAWVQHQQNFLSKCSRELKSPSHPWPW